MPIFWSHLDKIPAGCDSYFRHAITETINTLFPVVNFLKCVVTEVMCFMTLTFHKVV